MYEMICLINNLNKFLRLVSRDLYRLQNDASNLQLFSCKTEAFLLRFARTCRDVKCQNDRSSALLL